MPQAARCRHLTCKYCTTACKLVAHTDATVAACQSCLTPSCCCCCCCCCCSTVGFTKTLSPTAGHLGTPRIPLSPWVWAPGSLGPASRGCAGAKPASPRGGLRPESCTRAPLSICDTHTHMGRTVVCMLARRTRALPLLQSPAARPQGNFGPQHACWATVRKAQDTCLDKPVRPVRAAGRGPVVASRCSLLCLETLL